jgi:hypothetical protein
MAQDIGLLLRGLGAAFSNQVPQFRQQMAQEQETRMRQQEYEAQQDLRGRQIAGEQYDMAEKIRIAGGQDAFALTNLLDPKNMNLEAAMGLVEDRLGSIELAEKHGIRMQGDPTRAIHADMQKALLGDTAALQRARNVAGVYTAQAVARGDIKLPEVQGPLSTVGKIEADFKANRITQAQRDQAMLAASRGGTSVNVNASAPTPPAGYQNIFDESGRLAEQRPIQGSPAATAQATREEQQQRYGDVVIEDIDRYKNLIVNQGLLTPVTGISGAIAQAIPGTPAADARALEQTIGANIQFDRLQAMREASPTGGALGSITEKELSDLRATLGSIGRSQSDAQLIQNLTRLENMYSEIKRKADAYPGGTAMPSVTPSINGSQGTQNSDPLGLRRGQ